MISILRPAFTAFTPRQSIRCAEYQFNVNVWILILLVNFHVRQSDTFQVGEIFQRLPLFLLNVF